MDNKLSDLLQRDHAHFWHPCSQMKDYEVFKPLVIKRAQGDYLYLSNGKKIIDAISSWWCKSLGHHHPRLKKALQQQIERFEHVIAANTTNNIIVELSEKLASLTPTLNKVLYASDGSCAVEMAMKLSLHTRVILGDKNRTKFMALENSYHGETVGCMSVSDLGLYVKPYHALTPQQFFLKKIPYVQNKQDPLWNDCSSQWPLLEKQLNEHAKELTAIIIEPILQGAGGMKIYSQDFLRRLRRWATENDIHLIADEIMTGFGRTGEFLACDHADIEPDFLCLSKGLTSGWLPMSVALTSDKIYDYFYDDYEAGKSFLHSHTYSANPLAAAVALECLNIIEDEHIINNVRDIEPILKEHMQEVAEQTGHLKNIRSIGALVAADLVVSDNDKRQGYAVYQRAIALGALLRPLGNTLYWMPPLNTNKNTLSQLKEITIQAINDVYEK